MEGKATCNGRECRVSAAQPAVAVSEGSLCAKVAKDNLVSSQYISLKKSKFSFWYSFLQKSFFHGSILLPFSPPRSSISH